MNVMKLDTYRPQVDSPKNNMVREMEWDDIDCVVRMCRKMYPKSNYAPLEFNESKLRASLRKAVKERPWNFRVFVLSSDHVIGGIGCTVDTGMQTDDLIARDILLCVDKEGTKHVKLLVKAYEEWATARGAKILMLGHTTGIGSSKAYTRFTRSMGYREVGCAYFKSTLSVL